MTNPLKTPTELLIESILQKLKDGFAHRFSVELFPQSPKQYRLNHPNGALLLSYTNSSFAATQDIGAVVQKRTVTVRITLMLRQLWGTDGAVAVLDQLRLLLLGFKPAQATKKLIASKEDFLDLNEGIWQYGLTLNTQMMQVEQAEDEVLPLLKKLTFEEQI